jgi:hypothetical protein
LASLIHQLVDVTGGIGGERLGGIERGGLSEQCYASGFPEVKSENTKRDFWKNPHSTTLNNAMVQR